MHRILLGLICNVSNDSFLLKIDLPEEHIFAKRRVLKSHCQNVWSPKIVVTLCHYFKIILQNFSLENLHWYPILPTELMNQWTEYHRDLVETKPIHLPLWFSDININTTVELHGSVMPLVMYMVR